MTMLSDVNAPLVGGVLNLIDARSDSAYYYAYSYKYYRKYYSRYYGREDDDRRQSA